MIEIVTEPAGPAVTEEELRQHLRLLEDDTGYEDDPEAAVLATYRDAATARVEAMTGRALIKRTLRLTVDGFGRELEIPAGPVSGIVSLKYDDPAGATHDLASADYALIDRRDRPRLIPAHGKTWPKVRAFPGSVRVTFHAGYGDDAADVPAPLRLAICQTVADWYRFRGSVATTNFGELPEGAYRACQPFRREWA